MSSLNESSRLARLRSAARRAAGAAALAEEALEHDARMRLGRERRRRRRPGEAILIDARVAVVAHAGERVQVHRQLERRQLRVAADLLRGDLVDRRAEDSSPSSRCAWRTPRSGIPRSMCRACPGRHSSSRGW